MNRAVLLLSIVLSLFTKSSILMKALNDGLNNDLDNECIILYVLQSSFVMFTVYSCKQKYSVTIMLVIVCISYCYWNAIAISLINTVTTNRFPLLDVQESSLIAKERSLPENFYIEYILQLIILGSGVNNWDNKIYIIWISKLINL